MHNIAINKLSPERQAQVISALIWGAILGTGLLTYIEFPAYLILLAWLAIVGDPSYGVIVGCIYGAVRASPVVASGLRQILVRNWLPNPAKVVRTRTLWHPVNGVALLIFSAILFHFALGG